MFKIKYKILLLLMLFTFAGNYAWAGNDWWCYQIEVDVKLVTGEGLVYDPDPGEIPGTIEVGEVNGNNAYARSDAHNVVENDIVQENRFYFQQHTPNLNHDGKGDEWVMKSAVPNTQNPNVSYIFKGWMYAGNAGDGSVVKHVSGNNATFNVGEYLKEADYLSNIGGYAFYASTQHKCTYTGENGVSTGDKDHIQAHKDSPPVYTNDAIIYALFEKQELTPAVTIQYDLDKCEVEYPVDYQTNAIGKTITITARRKADTEDKGWEKEFVGWADEDGNIVSTDNPWTLNIEKKAIYRAVIEDRYRFFRIKNYGEPHRYVSAISDEASSDDFMDLVDNIELLKLSDNKDEIICDAGSIVQIDVLQNPYQSSATYVDLTVQNSKASKFYKFERGVTIKSLPYDYITKTWNFKAPLVLFRDDSGVPKMQAISDNYSKWIIEHIDLDLETKENYFSLDPAKLVEVDGKYYTTLRTSWNILFNPKQMTPYIVKSVDETEGTFEMEPITGNIIPAGTPVIIETKSNDVEENRMVPTLTNAANGAVPSGNLLQHSEKYFPNQSVNTSDNYKGLTLVNGKIGFGGNALSTIDGNHGYLQLPGDAVLKIPEVTLAELLASGDTERTYKVTDLTAIELVEQGRMLICKDNGGYANKDKKSDEEYIDFMHTATLTNGIKSAIPASYDQSNWIGLRLSDNKELSYLLKSYPLKGVVGKLTSTVNPEFILEQAPEADGEALSFTPNVYIAASFNSVNHQSGKNGKEYFFVLPKPMEYANVEWAQWDGEKFIAPVHDASHPEWNQNELRGEFEFNGSYLEQGGAQLESGHSYEMLPAIIKYNDGSNNAHVYVLGNVNGQGWSPRKGVEMSTRDGNIYTTTVTVDNAGEGYGYFSFSKKLGGANDDDWAAINSERFVANTESMNYPVDNNNMGQPLPLRDDRSDGTRSFKIATGTYRLTVNLNEKTLIITAPASYTPSLKAASGGYTVYPLQINKVTTEENGVITALDGLVAGKAVARVVYYNTMGVASDVPHRGINIVVTEYSDGSRTAVKMLR